MLPVEHLASKIPMSSQLLLAPTSLTVGLGGTCYHKNEGATPRAAACMHNLQYDGRPDGCFWVQVRTWNLGGVSGKGGEVCEEL